MGVVIYEDDAGGKMMTKGALARTQRELHKKFVEACRNYWYKVWETARELCLQYGAYDTGALYESIRLIWSFEPYGGVYEVAVSSQGAEMVAMIKVGGMEFINPKTGRCVNYAEAVHDGTRYMAARPFLTDAIALCEPDLQAILSMNIDEALSGFERDY